MALARLGDETCEKSRQVELSYRFDFSGRSVSRHDEGDDPSISEGRDVPIVLVHGVGNSHVVWDQFIQDLPVGRVVLRYDLRGHGASAVPAGPYSVDDFACDHVELLQRLGIEQCDLVGASLGALIAQRIAISYPSTVRKLVLISGVANRTEAQKQAAEQRLEVLEQNGPTGLLAQSGERWFTDTFRADNPDLVDYHLRRMSQTDPDGYLHSYRVLARTDLIDEVHRIEHPTLVMTGEYDEGSRPEMSRAMSETIQDARLRIVEGARHALLLEFHQVVADEVGAFLAD